jgi:hypothetical protein
MNSLSPNHKSPASAHMVIPQLILQEAAKRWCLGLHHPGGCSLCHLTLHSMQGRSWGGKHTQE